MSSFKNRCAKNFEEKNAQIAREKLTQIPSKNCTQKKVSFQHKLTKNYQQLVEVPYVDRKSFFKNKILEEKNIDLKKNDLFYPWISANFGSAFKLTSYR